tara:strand:- start:1969 stop:2889 length:921 start_codon:yes stop_codon:yes gene_type:complete
MKIGLIGLGRMGDALSQNMIGNGHKVVAYDKSSEMVDKIKKIGAMPAYSLDELVNNLDDRKVVWIMVPAGEAVDENINALVPLLGKGDIIIDGGNSFYKDSIRHAEELNKKNIQFLDIGTSGGIRGARNNGNFMIGGNKSAFEHIEPIIKDISQDNGYGYFGKAGSGHFVKMVHNGIEYGMMQAIGEGMEVIEKSKFDVDKEKLCRVWANGSVIRSWLIELVEEAYKRDKKLSKYSGRVGLSGEGEWTVLTAKELGVSVPVIEGSVKARLKSMKKLPGAKKYQGKVVQALRFGFGGHAQPKEKNND